MNSASSYPRTISSSLAFPVLPADVEQVDELHSQGISEMRSRSDSLSSTTSTLVEDVLSDNIPPVPDETSSRTNTHKKNRNNICSSLLSCLSFPSIGSQHFPLFFVPPSTSHSTHIQTARRPTSRRPVSDLSDGVPAETRTRPLSPCSLREPNVNVTVRLGDGKGDARRRKWRFWKYSRNTSGSVANIGVQSGDREGGRQQDTQKSSKQSRGLPKGSRRATITTWSTIAPYFM